MGEGEVNDFGGRDPGFAAAAAHAEDDAAGLGAENIGLNRVGSEAEAGDGEGYGVGIDGVGELGRSDGGQVDVPALLAEVHHAEILTLCARVAGVGEKNE